MYKQMDISDFIELPIAPKTLFEQIFEKVQDPVMNCANCLCQYCTHNAEELYNTVTLKEAAEPCFKCDECKTYTGDCIHKEQRREQCDSFIMSDYGVNRNRKKFRVIQGGAHEQT